MNDETVHMAARVPIDLEKRVQNHIDRGNVRTKSHFLIEAIEFYSDFLDKKEDLQSQIQKLQHQVKELEMNVVRLQNTLEEKPSTSQLRKLLAELTDLHEKYETYFSQLTKQEKI